MTDDSPFTRYVDCGGMQSEEIDVREYVPEGMVIVDQGRFARMLAVCRGVRVHRQTEDGAIPYWHSGDLDDLP